MSEHNTGLDFDLLGGDSTGPTIVLMHGRGTDRSDMAGLHRFLPRDWSLVLPDAPHPAAPWGYGPGRAWYRYLGGTTPEPDSFSLSLERVEQLIQSLDTGAPVFLGGFSQGGTVALGYMLSGRPGVTGVFNFSGFVPEHPQVDVAANAARKHVFWGHGTQDPNIPFQNAIAGRSALRDAGALLSAHDFPIGHWIAPEEIELWTGWVRETAKNSA